MHSTSSGLDMAQIAKPALQSNLSRVTSLQGRGRSQRKNTVAGEKQKCRAVMTTASFGSQVAGQMRLSRRKGDPCLD